MMTLISLVLASTTSPDDVVVYPDRAQVTRRTQVTCGQRTATVFEGVPPAAVADSFRALVTSGTVDGLRAELVRGEKQFSQKAEALEQKLQALTDEGRVLDDKLARTEAGRTMAARLREVAEHGLSTELASDKADVKAWSTALETPLSAALAAAKQSAELVTARTVLNRTIEETRRQLDEVRLGAQQSSYRVEVLVSCAAGTAQLSLTYLVGGASWTPAYEARANENTKTVTLSTYATVTQLTGERWADVSLSLSTAIPSQNATPPTMMKLLLGASERPPEKKVLTRRDEFVDTVTTGSIGSSNTREGLVAKAQGLSVQLEVKGNSSVPGDGAPARLFVGDSTLAAVFELKVWPRVTPVAFRVAQVTNTGAWPLLAGRLDAFRSTGMVGRYDLERVAQGAPFTLTFGLEDSIRVKRVVVEELKKGAGLFNSKQRFTFVYRFDLTNYGKSQTDVVVVDQVPVAEVNDLEIGLTEKTTAGGELNKASGLVSWKVPLKPQEKRTLDFGFRVDVPSTYDLGGL